MDVNIMPTSVYSLVFKDSQLKKIAHSNMEIGTYTTDTVKIVGSYNSIWSTQTLKSYRK